MKVTVGSVSRGTMRTQGLIPALFTALHEINETPGPVVMGFGDDLVPQGVLDDESHEWWDSDAAGYMLGELFDALDQCAPDDHYFGAHPGDRSDYGFWPIEEEPAPEMPTVLNDWLVGLNDKEAKEVWVWFDEYELAQGEVIKVLVDSHPALAQKELSLAYHERGLEDRTAPIGNEGDVR